MGWLDIYRLSGRRENYWSATGLVPGRPLKRPAGGRWLDQSQGMHRRSSLVLHILYGVLGFFSFFEPHVRNLAGPSISNAIPSTR